MKKTILMENCKAQFHGTFDNSKLGGKELRMMAVSYAPGNGIITFTDGRAVSDCPGTCSRVDCSGCQGACYAVRAYKQYPTVTINRVENTMQLRTDIKQHFADMEKAIKENDIKVVRYTESGELESHDQMIELYNLAIRTPGTRFYLYTKNYQVLKCFFDFRVLPDNMVVLVSVWGNVGLNEWEYFKKYKNVKCFAVNSDMAGAVYCPAYKMDKNGKVKRVTDARAKCANCKLCFDSRAKIIKCLEH